MNNPRHVEPRQDAESGAVITADTRTEAALSRAAIAVSSVGGEQILADLLHHLTGILGAEIAFIATYTRHDSPQMRTLALVIDGGVIDNIEYNLSGTPCEQVVGQEFRYYSGDLLQRFPGDAMLPELEVESYAAFPLYDADGKPLGLVAALSRGPMHDVPLIEAMLKIFAARITGAIEHDRAEAALRASEASYRAIFEAAEDSIFIHDWDTGAILDVNPKACSVYGYSRDEMRHIRVRDISLNEPPYTEEEAGRLIDQAKQGRAIRFDWRAKRKDGSLMWHEVTLKSAVIAGQPRILAFTRDITARRHAEAEQRRLEAQLRQAQKMEAIGHLTGGIAHDFNNLLTSIMGHLVLAAERETVQRDARLRRYLEQAQQSCERARDLIRQMLTFSRGGRGEARPVDLGSRIRELVQLLRSTLPTTIEIDTGVAGDLPPVHADPVHIDQILLNLCINARDAMAGDGAIRIEASSVAIADAVCASCRQPVSGELVAVSVTDSGPGIDPAIIDRMFEPFFSTKEIGKGSGMGLATVHGIVHEHCGHILVDSAPGAGAAFRILLPALAAGGGDEAVAASAGARTVQQQPRLQGNVMVVEDDPAVGEFMRDLLEYWGLAVTLAPGGVEAWEHFRAAPTAIDLVITDQTMPRLGGLDLARRLHEARPDLPVVLYSAYLEGLDRSALDDAGITAGLAKPVDPGRLLEILKTCLGEE
jgi:PAS domain S-box-containing protein